MGLLVIVLVVVSSGLRAGDERLPDMVSPDAPRDLPPLVFVSRHHPKEPGAIPGFGPRDRTLAVGGRLMRLDSGKTLSVLVDSSLLFDVADPCVSWDARHILFSGLVHPDSSWRIYEVNVGGGDLRQVTFTDRSLDLSQFGAAEVALERYDDLDPCYLPDGRIVFSSTRYPSVAGYGRLRTSNLYVTAFPGAPPRRITSERNGGEEPTIDPTSGRIVYARWWLNRDRPSNEAKHGITRDDALALTDDEANIWQAISIRSDGEGMKLYAGFPRTREGMQTYKPSVMSDGRLLSVYTERPSIINGPGGTGIRWFRQGADFEHPVIGVRSDQSPAGLPSATDPVEFDASSILCALAETGGDFGIVLCSLDGATTQTVVDLEGTDELEPQLLVPRPVPPVLAEEFAYPTGKLPPTEDPRTYLRNDTFRFDCMNIFTNAPVDDPMPDAPRIAVGAKIRFFMNVQRQNPEYPDPSIFLKDAPVFLTGGIHEHDIPADVPLFEQVVDSNEQVLERTDGGFAHVTGMNFDRMGSGTKCVGCHPGHSALPVPINGSLAEWFNAATSASVSASSRGLLPDGTESQPRRVVDRRALTGGINAVWVANEGEGAWVGLRWDLPIEIMEVVLYGIPENLTEKTTISVHQCRIMLYFNNALVLEKNWPGEIPPEGLHIPLLSTDIDSMRIQLGSFSGKVLGRPVAGLAEVETIARISSVNYSKIQGGSE